jgi:peptide/nickel transport system permease protein
MRWVDFKASVKDFWFEFRRQKGGLLGLALLFLLVFTALAAPYITEPDIPDKWPTYWEGNPTNVPPIWYNYFTNKKLAAHEVLTYNDLRITPEQDLGGGIKYYAIEFDYINQYDLPPKDLIIKNIGVKLTDINSPAQITITLVRPDGQTVELLTTELREGSTFQVAKTGAVVNNVFNWAAEFEDPKALAGRTETIKSTMDVMRVIFAKAQPGILINPEPLHGKYTFLIEIFTFNEGDKIDLTPIVITLTGRTYGIMGTDYMGRDLWAGLVWGTRVSLTVGVSVAVLTVLIGISFGVTSAYLGGWRDEFMQRVNEFVASIPVLPILILLGAAFKGHVTLWTIVFLMVIFYWTGIAKVARSMALQIKEQTYVEAARALGAGTGRIIFKHILPQIMPYAFAAMALNVPGAVLTEASLSFLGLGDPTAVTWGQILYDAQTQSATINGYWWWVIPPGLAIALVALTFVLIGVALDRVLNPRLKRL